MGKVIAIVGAGAVGGYVGGLMAKSGLDVTLIEPWPEHVSYIHENGIQLHGVTPDERHSIPVDIINIDQVQEFAKRKPIDIAMISLKSYDTEWATMLVRPYLAPDGYVVSLQNCINEERIANIVGWGKTVGCVVAKVSSELVEAGHIHRTVPMVGDKGLAFYVGEVHGRITSRIEELSEMIGTVDSCEVTSNLWGQRWSKLCVNAMRNGASAATGLGGNARDRDEPVRRFTIRLVGEAIRIGQALGYDFSKVMYHDAEKLARAAEGDGKALAAVEEAIIDETKSSGRSDKQRPSMAQDIDKGRAGWLSVAVNEGVGGAVDG
ncbi:MAG: 2-dehydropantoate 2-reductase, partial [Rhodospirillales bacterium]|nr:2-dehydropantoate 2-reductase [Rhodospirillales bacterium]